MKFNSIEEAVKDSPELMLELMRLRKAKEQLDKINEETNRRIKVYLESNFEK